MSVRREWLNDGPFLGWGEGHCCAAVEKERDPLCAIMYVPLIYTEWPSGSRGKSKCTYKTRNCVYRRFWKRDLTLLTVVPLGREAGGWGMELIFLMPRVLLGYRWGRQQLDSCSGRHRGSSQCCKGSRPAKKKIRYWILMISLLNPYF